MIMIDLDYFLVSSHSFRSWPVLLELCVKFLSNLVYSVQKTKKQLFVSFTSKGCRMINLDLRGYCFYTLKSFDFLIKFSILSQRMIHNIYFSQLFWIRFNFARLMCKFFFIFSNILIITSEKENKENLIQKSCVLKLKEHI